MPRGRNARGRFSNSPITQLLETSYSLKNSKLETSYSFEEQEGPLISVHSAPLQKEFSMALEEKERCCLDKDQETLRPRAVALM